MKNGFLMICLLAATGLFAQSGNIQGKISTSDGQPAAEVNVILLNNKATTAGADGSFVLKNIKPGSYRLRVSHEGLQRIEQTVAIKAGTTLELNFTLYETARELEEVVVETRRTANTKELTIGKAPIAAMDLPQAVSVVNRAVIEGQQAQRLSDVLRNANGVYLSSTRGAASETFSARGYSLSSNNIFKDGVRINSGSFPETGSLERVEVLKGSAAVLYGNVAAGGIINLVTKQPKFNNGGEVSLRGRSFGLFKPSIDLYGPVTKDVAFRVNGSFETADSYRDMVHSKRYYVNPSVLIKLDKKTELLVQGDYLDHQFTPDFGIGSINNTSIPDVPRSAFFGTPWQYAKVKQGSATANLKHTLNANWNISAVVSYQQYNRDYYAIERVQAQANGDFYRPLNRSKNAESYYSAQANLAGKLQTGKIAHTILFGADADSYDATAYTFNQPAIYDTINILDANKYRPRTDIPAATAIKMVKTPTMRVGVYVQDLISVTNKLKVLIGGRWSLQDGKSAATTDLTTKTTTYGAVKTDKAFSPRAGVVYQPAQHTSLFASYANSFSVNSGTDVNGNVLPPSIIDQFEVGIKNDLISNRLSVNLTVYKIINNNLAQTALFLADGVTPNNNTALKEMTGQTMSDGLELDLNAHLLKGLDVMAGYSYNYIRYTKTPDATGNYVEGERLQNSVGSTANTSVTYAVKGWKFSAGCFYTGPRYAGFNNKKGQTQNYNRLFEVKGFATVDISAGYSFKKFSILAKISNLTNTFNYNTHENYSINPIPPTQVVATVGYRF